MISGRCSRRQSSTGRVPWRLSPKWAPPYFAEQRMAWEVASANVPDAPLRVEAALEQSQLVYFKVFRGPWDQPDAPRGPFQPEPRLFQFLYAALFCLVLIGASWLARRNLRMGLGDATGAVEAGDLPVCLPHDLHDPGRRPCSLLPREAVWLMKALGFAGSVVEPLLAALFCPRAVRAANAGPGE